MMTNRISILQAVASLLLAWAAASSVAVAQTYTVLYDFATAPGPFVQGRDGFLRTTSQEGGTHDFGTAFKITPAGELTVICNFFHDRGVRYPTSGLTLATDRNSYGTTTAGGSFFGGVIFNITQRNQLNVLYNFNGTSDGNFPAGPPIQGTDGNFYGMMFNGGDSTCNHGDGCGTVYKFTRSGQFKVLYTFKSQRHDGLGPESPLVQGTDGNFYGTTSFGGESDAGVVFKITPTGKFTVIHSFNPYSDGKRPLGSLIQGNDGNFYGTTEYGGVREVFGTVFKISPAGQLTVLHRFRPSKDGANPYGTLVQATDGNFYGTSAYRGPLGKGTIFRVNSKGTFEVLHNFDGTAGGSPEFGLVQHTNGLLYGSADVFYSLDVGLESFVGLLPNAGKVGETIDLLGQGFRGSTSVSFNGTPANFTVETDTDVRVAVPNGATTGFVMVNTPGGILKSNKKFQVVP
jgi:uncharacterized repeat protein (TIGR03803 family)